MAKKLKRDGYLDLLRFLFALSIIGVHSNACGFSYRLISSGYLGVEFFFMVSGYFIAKSAMQDRLISRDPQNIIRHFAHRLKKIMPIFFISFLYGFIVVCILEKATSVTAVFQLFYANIFDLFPLQIACFPAISLTGVQWYIGALLVISPILYALILRYGEVFSKVFAPLIGLFALGSVYLQIASFSAAGILMYNSFLCGLPIGLGNMFLGATVYELSCSLSRVNFTILGRLVIRTIRILLLVGIFANLFAVSTGYNDLVFILAIFFYLCLLFAHPVCLPTGLNRICAELGKISTVVFLVHIKTGEWINRYLAYLPETERFVLYYIVSLGIAYVFYYVIKFSGKKLKKLFLA